MLKMENIRRVVCGAYQTNCWLVCPDGRDDAFLVDAGDDLAALQSAIRASGRRLSAILLTHGHFDHILAAQPLSEVTGAAVYVHPYDGEMLENPEFCAYNPDVCRLAPPTGLTYRPLSGAVEVCGEQLTVIHTPGHTRGSSCFFEPTGKILFCGDTLFRCGYGRTDLHGGSMTALARSLKILLALDGETTALCGHGDDTVIGVEKQRYHL